MGYELRRKLRTVLGPDITGLQRAVALEIADDANDGTRLSWASLEDIALWTGAKDVNVVRNALKRLAACGWEFRVPIGKGKDGRLLYAVPGKRMTFRVPDFEGVATAPPFESKGEPPLPIGVAPAPSEGAGAPSVGAPATPFSSSPHDSSPLSSPDSAPPSDVAAEEREKTAEPPKATAAQRAVRVAGVVTVEEETAFIAWCVQKFSIQGPGWWKTCAGDLPEHAAAWRASLAAGSGRPGAPPLPPWCGECDGEVVARRWIEVPDAEGRTTAVRCPRCHPARARPSAA